MKKPVNDVELSVKHSPRQALKNFYKKRKVFVWIVTPLILLTIFAVYIQYNLLNTRGRAEVTTLNVKDFGAKGDGVTNDTQAIRDTATAAIAQNAVVYFPTGRYKVELNSSSPNLFDYSKKDLTVIGEDSKTTILDVYPKVLDFQLNVFYNWKGSTNLTVKNLDFWGPTSYTAAGAHIQQKNYVVYNIGSVNPPSTGGNILFENNRTTQGKFYDIIYVASGHGSVTVRDSILRAWSCVINNYDSSGTIYDRYTLVERSDLASGSPPELNVDNTAHGIIVYNHPHVSLKIVDSILRDNPRGGAKQYGESVAYLTPQYSELYNVRFINNEEFTFITPGAPNIVSYIRNSVFDKGRIGLRSDLVVEGSYFLNDARFATTVYSQPLDKIHLTIRNTKFASSKAQVIPPGITNVVLENVEFNVANLTPPPFVISNPPTGIPVVTINPTAAATPTLSQPIATPTPTPPSTSAEVIKFYPSDDATIFYDKPSNNYGEIATDNVDASARQDFLMKFYITGIGSRPVQKVILKLYNESGSDKGGDFKITSNSWSESTLTWNNAPAGDTLIRSLGSVNPGNWYSVDLTSLIKRDGTYSLRASSASTNGADYSSKESGNSPVLEVTVGSIISTLTPTNTPTSVVVTQPIYTPTPVPTKAPTPTPTIANSYGITVMAIDIRRYRILSCSITSNLSQSSGTTPYTKTFTSPISALLTAPSKCQGRKFTSWSSGATTRSLTATDLTANNGESVYTVYYK